MKLNEYQKLAKRTRPNDVHSRLAANFSMGLSGEAGETVDYLKKVIFHGHPIDKGHLTKELGDVLWYIANLSDIYEIELEEIAENNINKLKKRYPEGFTEESSIKRVDTK